MSLIGKFFRNKRKHLSLFVFLLLLLSLPITVYFVTSERSFDSRSEAAIFNALVSEMEVKIQQSPGHESGVIILEFPENVSSEEIEKITGKPRSTPEVLKNTPFERFEYVRVPQNEKAREMAKYERYSPAKDVNLNYFFEAFWVQDGNDRVLSSDWNNSNHWYFDKIKLPEVWKLQGCENNHDYCGGSEDIIVAVIDSGLGFSASEVSGHMNVFRPSDYTQSGFSGRDDFGHGTPVAGVIASATNNNSNSPVGMAHDVSILSLKTNVPYTGRFSFNSVNAAIFYAVKSGANVINLSLGTNQTDHGNVLSTAIGHAVSNGVVVVAASGNEGLSRLAYPASDSRVIAVGAVNANNSRSSYSQYGSGLDFVAPVGQGSTAGNAVWQQTLSCFPNCSSRSNLNSFSNRYFAGTSFAAPQVAGAAALIMSLNPSLSPSQVKNVLIATVDSIGTTSQTGHGLLNLKNIYEHFGIKPGPQLQFSVSPKTIKYGEVAKLQWSSNNTIGCESYGGWTGARETSGEKNISPPFTTEYKMTCFNENEQIDASVTLEVQEVSLDFTASSEFIELGDTVTLSWEASGVSECEAKEGWSGAKELSGTKEVQPERDVTYTILCSQFEKTVTKAVFIEVRECIENEDCRQDYPVEICHRELCLRGDIARTGMISMIDFAIFKRDFVEYKSSGWDDSLLRSDLNTDLRISMADYSIFVRSYRLYNGLD